MDADLVFHAFDAVDAEACFSARNAWVQELLRGCDPAGALRLLTARSPAVCC